MIINQAQIDCTKVIVILLTISCLLIDSVLTKSSTKVKCYSPSSQMWYFTEVDELGSSTQQQTSQQTSSVQTADINSDNDQLNKPSVDSATNDNARFQFVSGNGVDECYFVKENFINGNHATYVEPPADFKPIIYDQNQQKHQQNLQKERLDEEQFDQQQQLSNNQVSASASSLVPILVSPSPVRKSSSPTSDNFVRNNPHQSPMRWSEWKDMSIEPEFAASVTDSEFGERELHSSTRDKPSSPSVSSSHYQLISFSDDTPFPRRASSSNLKNENDEDKDILITADANSIDASLAPSTVLFRKRPTQPLVSALMQKPSPMQTTYYVVTPEEASKLELNGANSEKENQSDQSLSVSQQVPNSNTLSDILTQNVDMIHPKNPSNGNDLTTFDDEKPVIMVPPAMYRKRVGSSLKVVTIQRNPKKNVKKSITDNGKFSHGQDEHVQYLHPATKLSTSADSNRLSQLNGTFKELPLNSVQKLLSPSQSVSTPAAASSPVLGQKSSYSLNYGYNGTKANNGSRNGSIKKNKRRRKSKSNKEVRLLLNSNALVSKSDAKISQQQHQQQYQPLQRQQLVASSSSNGQTVSSKLETTGNNDMNGRNVGNFGSITYNNVALANLQQFKQHQAAPIIPLAHDNSISAAKSSQLNVANGANQQRQQQQQHRYDPQQLVPADSRRQVASHSATHETKSRNIAGEPMIQSQTARQLIIAKAVNRAGDVISNKQRLPPNDVVAGSDGKSLTSQDQTQTVDGSISRRRRNRIRTLLPVGLTSWFLGGIRDLDGRHWHLPGSVIDKLAVNDVDFMPVASSSTTPATSNGVNSSSVDSDSRVGNNSLRRNTKDYEFINPR